MIAGMLGLFVCVCAGWALTVDDPLGGEPVAVVATGFDPPKGRSLAGRRHPRRRARPAQLRRAGNPGSRSRSQIQSPGASAARPAPPANAKTVTIIDGSTGKRQEVPISASRDIRAPLEQRMLETSRHGAIPRIAPGRRRPVRSLCPRRQPLRPQGRTAGSHRDRRARRQRRVTQQAIRNARRR